MISPEFQYKCYDFALSCVDLPSQLPTSILSIPRSLTMSRYTKWVCPLYFGFRYCCGIWALCAAYLVVTPLLASVLPATEWLQEKVWEKRAVSEVTAKVSEPWFDLMALRLLVTLRPDGMNSYWSRSEDPKGTTYLIVCEKADST